PPEGLGRAGEGVQLAPFDVHLDHVGSSTPRAATRSIVSTGVSIRRTLPVPTARSPARGGRPRVPVAPVASSRLNPASPAPAPAAQGTTVTLWPPFAARFARKRARFSGSGSNARTRPDGPTNWESRVEKNPMLAPTSKTTSPGSTAARRAR